MTRRIGRESKSDTETKLKQRLLNFGCNNEQVENYLHDFRVKKFKARSTALQYRNLIIHLDCKLKMIDPVLEPETYTKTQVEKIEAMKDLNRFKLKNSIYLEESSH